MNGLFVEFLHRNLYVSVVIAVVILARLCMRKLPKKYSYMLWGIVGIRMLFDLPIQSAVSLFNFLPERWFGRKTASAPKEIGNPLQGNNVDFSKPLQPVIPDAGQPAVQQGVAEAAAKIDMAAALMTAGAIVWVIGILAMTGMGIYSYYKTKKMTEEAVWLRKNIYECEKIPTPFVLGLLKPVIYIPFRLGRAESEYVLCHEAYHIRRRDIWIKFLAYLLLTVYWMNPLAWAAFYLMVLDMEMSCDKAVLLTLGSGIKKEYSTSLLSFAIGKRSLTIAPLAFGESDASKRIKHVLKFAKPKVWGTILGIAVVAVILLLCLTDAKANGNDADGGTDTANKADSGATGSGRQTENDDAVTAALNRYAEAFCGRDGDAIAEMCDESAREALTEEGLLEVMQEGTTFGWSSPWPFGLEINYKLQNIRPESADIYYYALTSEPHVTVWIETVAYQYENDTFSIIGESMEYMDRIGSAAEFYRAYPDGIDGTAMDYLQNGLAEFLNENALLSSSGLYHAYMEPASSVAALLNLDGSAIEACEAETIEEGAAYMVSVTFAGDAPIEIGAVCCGNGIGVYLPTDNPAEARALVAERMEGRQSSLNGADTEKKPAVSKIDSMEELIDYASSGKLQTDCAAIPVSGLTWLSDFENHAMGDKDSLTSFYQKAYPYEGRNYLFMVYYWNENAPSVGKTEGTVENVFICETASEDMRLLFRAGSDNMIMAKEAMYDFLNQEYSLDAYIDYQTPAGYALGRYEIDHEGLGPGCMIYSGREIAQSEMMQENEDAPKEWYSAGVFGIMPKERGVMEELLTFSDGMLIAAHYPVGNHMGEIGTARPVSGLAAGAMLGEVEFELFTVVTWEEYLQTHPDASWEEDGMSRFYYLLMADEDSENGVYLLMNQAYFSEEDVMRFARSIRIK